MSAPPPPPKKKNIKSNSNLETADDVLASFESLGSPAPVAASGSGYNVARLKTPPVIQANNFSSVDSNINDDLARQLRKEKKEPPEPKKIILPIDLLVSKHKHCLLRQ